MKKRTKRHDRSRDGVITVAAVMLIASMAAAHDEPHGQTHPIAPGGERLPAKMDSGMVADRGLQQDVGFTHLVFNNNAAWTRLFFEDVQLEGDSTIRFTSLLDGEVQELDARGIEMWSNASAFFNGDAVLIELIPGAGTTNNRFVLDEVAVEFADISLSNHCNPPLQCGICTQDDRVPSNENWAPRLLLASGGGCSSAIIDTTSCVLSAGHCMSSNMVIQFNVPLSNPDCSLNHPPVEDQFPITDFTSQNGGVGADWAVLTSGTNELGETAYERFGEFRPVATSVPSSGPAEVWGYGVSDDCTLGQSQQYSSGEIVGIQSDALFYTADVTCGNSGSSLLQNDEIIGIVTHCSFDCPPDGNTATRIDVAAFANAINTLCPGPVENDTCEEAIVVSDGDTEFSNVNAVTTGPDESASCTFDGDGDIRRDVWFEYAATCSGDVTISLCNSDPSPPSGQCAGNCGSSAGGCWCDEQCDGFGDCCPDVCNDCPELSFCDGTAGAFDTKLAVYGEDCPTSSGTVLDCNKDACDTLSEVTVSANTGDVFKIRIGGHNGETGSGTLTIDCEPVDEPDDCPADLTGTGTVDTEDLFELLAAWGPCSGCPADFDGNNVVDTEDLFELLAAWGDCP